MDLDNEGPEHVHDHLWDGQIYEVDYKPDPETIARESLRHMRECEAKAKQL